MKLKSKEKNDFIRIQLSSEFKAELSAIADKNGLPLSTFIRYVLVKYAGRENK